MQKIRLAIRGWNRRREERDREFLARNAWSEAPAISTPPRAAAPHGAALHIDIEGLSVAFLDDSGRIAYYLDVQTGDVVDVRDGSAQDPARYKRIPTASHDDDRNAFIRKLEDSGERARLSAADSFRAALAGDRTLERAWFNFRNDRALAAIDQWLRRIGLI